MTRRTGVLGGTFDPPHLAHVALADSARIALRLDRVVFVVAGDPWRKSGRYVSPASVRLDLVRRAVEPFSWAEVSTVEVDREGPSYTGETLETLAADGEPGEEWWFILGADALHDMAHWQEPQRILARARLAVARRPDADGVLVTPELREVLPRIDECIDIVDMPPLAISATDIRGRIGRGESTEFLLAPAVREQVERLNLYQD